LILCKIKQKSAKLEAGDIFFTAFVGESAAHFIRSTPTTGSFIFREDQQRIEGC
jgi:hypothetical protein